MMMMPPAIADDTIYANAHATTGCTAADGSSGSGLYGTHPPQPTMDSEQKEFMEMARARQMELPPDMRQKVQRITKKESVKATKDLHSAVRHLGHARAGLEEALQARFNLLSSWKTFLQDAVQTWKGHAALFESQEKELQERIQKAQEVFTSAKAQAAESQEEAGKIPTIEIKDKEGELEGGKPQLRSRLARSTMARPA